MIDDTHTDHALTQTAEQTSGQAVLSIARPFSAVTNRFEDGLFYCPSLTRQGDGSMTIQQFANEEFDEQKVERHEVRQVLRGVRQLTPEGWVEARRQRAAAARAEPVADEAKACPASTLQ